MSKDLAYSSTARWREYPDDCGFDIPEGPRYEEEDELDPEAADYELYGNDYEDCGFNPYEGCYDYDC